jgi:glycosyltransferase involved in cell wall biosynthesis
LQSAGGVRARPTQIGLGKAAPTAPATFITAQVGSDDYWRSKGPAKVLGAKVITVPPKVMERAFTQPNRSTPLPWRLEVTTEDGTRHTFSTKKAWKEFAATRPRVVADSDAAVFPTVEGAVVWQRPDMVRAHLSFWMRDAGIRVIGETDDNYFAKADQNLFLRHNRFDEKERSQHARAFATQDACVFSTAHLRDIYYRELRARLGKRNLPDMHVCRNHVPASDWPERSERDGPLRVGFMGSSSHVWDVNIAYAAFHAAKHHGAETLMVGYNPGDPDANTSGWDPGQEWRSEKSRAYSDKWSKVIDRHIPWIAPEEYHRAALPFDIGLCPLRTDSFCLGKSDVKMIELTISGAAGICQNMPVFNNAGWVHEETCLMATTYEDFAHATLRLMRDPKLRYELVANAQEYVAKERSDKQIKEEWGAAIDA